jgi:hypothetical protein
MKCRRFIIRLQERSKEPDACHLLVNANADIAEFNACTLLSARGV